MGVILRRTTKKMLPYFALGLIILIVVGYAYSTGFDFSKISPTQFTSYQDCSFGKLTVATIKCTLGQIVVVGPTDMTYKSSVNYYYKFADSSVTSTSERIEIQNTDSGEVLCSGTSTGSTPCVGKTLYAKTNYKITYCKGCLYSAQKGYAKINQPTYWLTWSDSFGANDVQLPNTQNCIAQDLVASVKAVSDTNIDETNINKNALPGSVTMDAGQTRTIPNVYVQTAPISAYSYNSQPAECDYANKKLTGYTQITALDGSCWYIGDSSNVLLQGGSDFCCVNTNCLDLGSSATCSNYKCYISPVVAPPETQKTCNVPNDCGSTTYVTDMDGKSYKVEPVCSGGFCQASKRTETSCNPLTSYGTQCCTLTDGVYSLQQCAEATNDCNTLGANACCLGAVGFTQKICNPGLKCCQGSTEITTGVGICADSCSGGPVTPPTPVGSTCSSVGQKCGGAFGTITAGDGWECVGEGWFGLTAGTCQKSLFGMIASEWITYIISVLAGFLIFYAMTKNKKDKLLWGVIGAVAGIVIGALLNWVLANKLTVLLGVGSIIILYILAPVILMVLGFILRSRGK